MALAFDISAPAAGFAVFGQGRGPSRIERDRAKETARLLDWLEGTQAEGIILPVGDIIRLHYRKHESGYGQLCTALTEHVTGFDLEVRVLALALKSYDHPGVALPFEALRRWLDGKHEMHPAPAMGIVELALSESSDPVATEQRITLAECFAKRLADDRVRQRKISKPGFPTLSQPARAWYKAILAETAERLANAPAAVDAQAAPLHQELAKLP